MSEIKIASRYAKSLLILAQEKGSLEAVNTDIRSFIEVCSQNSNLVNVLNSPIIFSDKKQTIINSIFQSFNSITKAFFNLVIRKRREIFLVSIAEQFVNEYNKLKGIAKAQVTTAFAVSPNILADIKSQIEKTTGKNVELSTKVNPAIIGGLVIQFEDTLFDASIAKKLNKIKKELINQ